MAVIERKLPGEPTPRAELVRHYEDWKHRNHMAGPVEAFLFDVHVPKPEETYQWRIELDCGCIRDVVSRSDDVPSLMDRSGKYWGWDKEVALAASQWLCMDPKCDNHRSHGGPVRDIAEWTKRHDDPYVLKPIEIDGEIIGREKTYAKWDVVLSCGHRDTELTALEWKAEDGPTYPRRRHIGLKNMLRDICRNEDDEAYWRRVYAEKHPEPVPFSQCRTCANLRSVVAYERVGWVTSKPKPIKPVKPQPAPRKTLERRLQKLETEAAALREELNNRPPDE
jgi:hypothetical protein